MLQLQSLNARYNYLVARVKKRDQPLPPEEAPGGVSGLSASVVESGISASGSVTFAGSAISASMVVSLAWIFGSSAVLDKVSASKSTSVVDASSENRTRLDSLKSLSLPPGRISFDGDFVMTEPAEEILVDEDDVEEGIVKVHDKL